MVKEERPDPETLLKAIQIDEKKQEMGRLKIFLGMAAGVGKTYAMLQAAQSKMKEGVDLLIGSVDTHGRPETAKLLEGLKIVPEKSVEYRGKLFKELDLDKILQLKPQLVLVDELAHTNIPGSRHLKRWQDVMELLEAGIDVFTTLNIQHIESFKDIIEEIAEVNIRETVPNLILEKASTLEMVDITVEELLKRLKEGKVYIGDLSEIAAKNFFQEDRLTALREIALRFAAEKVDQELNEMVSALQRKKGWRPRERLLVAINHHPYSQQLLRTTKRIAFTLHAPWMAVYVDTGSSLSEEENATLAKNFTLARELGGEVVTTQDLDIAEGIQRIAHQKGVTQIIVGKRLRKNFKDFFKPSLIKKLIQQSGDIDVHVIRRFPFFLKKKRMRKKSLSFSYFTPYLKVLFWAALITLFNFSIFPVVNYKIVGSIFLLGILLLSLFFKRGPIFLSSFLFALIWDYFFIPPEKTLYISSLEDIYLVFLLFLTGIVTGILTNRAKKRQELMLKREQTTQAIYEIVKEIAAAPSSEQLFKGIKERLGSILKGTCEIIIQKIDGGLNVDEVPCLKDEKEKAVALWVFENGKEAGWSTSTLPSVKNLFIPLRGHKEIVGVLAYQPGADKPLSAEETNFLYTIAQQLANYLERTFSEERERRNAHLQQIEKIYEKILNAISKELRPPLTDIVNTISQHKKEKIFLENPEIHTCLQKVKKSSESLLRIAENASEMARLSSGLITFQKSLHSIKSLIDAYCKKIEKTVKHHRLIIKVPENLPLIPLDFSLIEILLHNLVANAIEYSPPDTVIEIEADTYNDTFMLSISDEGKGIPEDMIDLIFEKFYRIPGTLSTGLGLGLAIAKSIAEIHHGSIKVQNRPQGGTKFIVLLPIRI